MDYAAELHHQGIDLLGHLEGKTAYVDATPELQHSSEGQCSSSVHTSKCVKTWLGAENYSLLEKWPVCSPDLNPIESYFQAIYFRFL